jgi:hypothetical protein
VDNHFFLHDVSLARLVTLLCSVQRQSRDQARRQPSTPQHIFTPAWDDLCVHISVLVAFLDYYVVYRTC